MLKYTVDIAFEDDLATTLADLASNVPSAMVRVVNANGPGGGWPEVVIVIDEADHDAFVAWYDAATRFLLGDDDVDEWVEGV